MTDSDVSSPGESPASETTSPLFEDVPSPPPTIPASMKSISASATTKMTQSSTPLGPVNAARRPVAPPMASSQNLPFNIKQRMDAVRLRGQPTTPGAVGSPIPASPGGMTPGAGGIPSNFRLPPGMGRPHGGQFQSAPAVPSLSQGVGKPSLADRRAGPRLGGLPGASSPVPSGAGPGVKRKGPGLKLSDMGGGKPGEAPAKPQSALEKYSDIIDSKTGSLNFKGKAVLNAEGVKFAGGTSFHISLDEVDTLDELGKGNYGTVYKVRHSRPKFRRPGQGLAGNKAQGPNAAIQQVPPSPTTKTADSKAEDSPTTAKPGAGSGIVMAMKELRLELEDAKFATIVMELDVLHRCVSPYIIDFYGAFFQEGAVYICIEFMDGGSLDKLYLDGVPESVLRKVTYATTKGLKFLKEEHNIIHRDVKPTNILVNTKGAIKICDFGVSGNLVASIARTNIGCQSYMAPERISTGGVAQAGANPGGGTYSVQSDIWSLGLTIIECALGAYPYPPETYNNIFSQLSAIVDGEPPDLPEEGFSEAAKNFVKGCLNKIPNLRPTYPIPLQHAWLAPLDKPAPIAEASEAAEQAAEAAAEAAASGTAPPVHEAAVDPEILDAEVAAWVSECLEKKKNGTLGKGKNAVKPALHAAPLDAMSSPGETVNGSLVVGDVKAGAAEAAA